MRCSVSRGTCGKAPTGSIGHVGQVSSDGWTGVHAVRRNAKSGPIGHEETVHLSGEPPGQRAKDPAEVIPSSTSHPRKSEAQSAKKKSNKK